MKERYGSQSWRRLVGTLFKFATVLLLLDWWVAGPFFDRYMTATFVTQFPILRDRTAGQNLGILFEATSRLPPERVRVALVGDSTMNTVGPDQTELPYFLRDEVRPRFGADAVDVIHCGIVGLYSKDALLLIANLLRRRVDVIVYGLEVRAFLHQPDAPWASRITDETGVGEYLNIMSIGGTSWLMQNLTADQAITGFVQSNWAAYAFRSGLRQFLWEEAVRPITAPDSWVAKALKPPPAPQPHVSPRVHREAGYEWSRLDYDFTHFDGEALDLIGRLCERYAPGRCVMYAGPINPIGRDKLAEPGLYEEYLTMLRVIANRHGLVWRDYTDAMEAADFRSPMYETTRDPIHLNEAGRAKLAKLLAEPVSEAIEHVLADRRDGGR